MDTAIDTEEQDRLCWHPDARVFDAAGNAVRPAGHQPDAGVMVLCTRPGTGAEDMARLFAGKRAPAGVCVAPQGADLAPLPAGGGAPWLSCMTSGSTGAPRLVRRSQRSWVLTFQQNARMWKIGPDDRYAVLGDLSHSLAFYAACEAVMLGAALDLLAGLRPDRQLLRLREVGATLLYATPAQLRMLIGARPDGFHLPALRKVFVGGAALDTTTRNGLRDLAPEAGIHAFYGASETSFITVADADTPPGSVGLPYPGVRLRVRDDNGGELPAGQTGELWVESPYLFIDYLGGEPGDTRWCDAALSVSEHGWLDARGYLYLTGRKGRMVTIADQNAYPEEVETCLLSIPGIRRAAVLAVPDARRGHVFVACIDTVDAPTDDAILATCRAALGPLRAPRRILRPRDWPVLASGKPDLKALGSLVDGALA